MNWVTKRKDDKAPTSGHPCYQDYHSPHHYGAVQGCYAICGRDESNWDSILMTISKHIKFGSAGKLDSMKNDHILKHFRAIIGAYVSRGFRVTIIIADNQFESMRGDIAGLGAILSVCARDEHVPEIERFNRTIKERLRAQYNVLPFQHLPPIMVVELVYSSVFWRRNMFTLKGGVSQTQSPSELILNRKLDFNAHCKITFGEYVQTHAEHTNDMHMM